MMKLWFLLLAVLIAGCAGTIEISGKPVVGINPARNKDGSLPAMVEIKQFGNFYQIQAPTATSPEHGAQTVTAVQEKAVVSPYVVYTSKWNDPRLVTLFNWSSCRVWARIDNNSPIELGPYQGSSDMRLEFGEHRIRMTVERGSPPDTFMAERHPFPVLVRPDGRAQTVNLYDYC